MTNDSRLSLLLSETNTMETIESHVANGGTLISLCEQWGVSFAKVLRWIKADDNRKKLYEASLMDRQEWTIERIKQECQTLGLVDIRELFDDKGAVKPIHLWPAGLGQAVEAIEINEEFDGYGADRVFTGYTKKVKFHSKLKALEMLGKTLAMFVDKVQLTGDAKLEDILAMSREGERASAPIPPKSEPTP